MGGIGVLIAADASTGAALPVGSPPSNAQLLTTVYRYDAWGGGIETANKEDKQGLGIGKRSKKRFAAQQVLGQLGRLAHNVVVRPLGVKRLVRDIFHVNGLVERDATGRIRRIVSNQAHYYARRVLVALQALLAVEHVAVSVGET